jgi:hypothetical protein
MSCFALQLIPVGSISDGTFWQLPFHTDLCQAHPPMTQVSGAPRVVLQVPLCTVISFPHSAWARGS